MITVGVRDLKNQLSQYLQYVKRGEKIIITEHNRVIAEISSPSNEVSNTEGSIYIIDPVSLKVGKRSNVPKKTKSLQDHFTVTCVNYVDKNTDFKNVIFVGSKGITKISSKLVKPTGVPRRVSLVPLGVHIL